MKGDVKPGYKMTEVGVIPEDWEVSKIGNLGTVVRGGSPRPAGDPRFFNGSFIPWLTVAALTNISENQLDVVETFGFLTEEGARFSRILEIDTLIIANSGATLGVAKLLRLRCCANDGIAAIVEQKKGFKEFVCFYINSKTVFLREVVATGNGQPNLNTELIREIPIPFPPTTEQKAIATALSDVDALIESLEQLIAKKRNIKHGAMQELLTGKRRLPGFRGEWEEKQINDIASPCSEKNTQAEELPVLACSKHFGFVDSMGYFKNQVFSRDTSGYKLVRRGQIAYPSNHVEEGSIGIQDLYKKALVSPIYVVFSVNEDVDAFYVHRLLKLEKYRQEFATATCSSVDRRGSLRWPTFSKIKVKLPPFDEQKEIARIILEMEEEVDAMDLKLSKTRHLKQAMMQELLTGRIRLV